MKNKEKVYFQICNSILKMEVAKGHLQWKISDIAKEANVSRSLIYYYFGKEKETILEEAYRFMVYFMYDRNLEKSWSVEKRIKDALRKMKEMPYLFLLYYLEKGKESVIGEMINEAENRLLTSIHKEFPNKNKDDILKIYLLELGAMAYKTLTPKEIDAIFQIKN